MVRIFATASDDGGVTSASILVDGVSLATLTGPPYAAMWDTDAAGGGVHTVRVEALDGEGNSGHDEAEVTVGGSPASECVIGTDASTDPFVDAVDGDDGDPDGQDLPPDPGDSAGDAPVTDADAATDAAADVPGEQEEAGGGDGCGCHLAR
jgi:hypothetical protein